MENLKLLKGGLVFTENGEFKPLNILIKGTKIEALLPHNENISEAEIIDCTDQILTPGFVDIHIHGREGFESTENTLDLAKCIKKCGVTAFLPTTLTTAFEDTLKNLEHIKNYIENQPQCGVPEAVGIYSEGMYFSLAKAGAQNPAFIRNSIPVSEIDKMIEAAGGYLKVIALAPENENSENAVAHIASKGLRASMGHTMSDEVHAKACVKAGMTGVTHTFNGMSGMSHLDLGASGVAVFADELYTELITDGYHVNKEFIEILMRFKPQDKVIFISDNVGASGTPEGEYELGGVPIINLGDRLVVDNGDGPFSLAGSCLRLCDSVKNVHKFTGIPFEKLIPCATVNPAKYVGIYDRKGSLSVGKDADINIFDKDFNLLKTFARGE